MVGGKIPRGVPGELISPNPLHLRSPAGHAQYLRHAGEVTWMAKAREQVQAGSTQVPECTGSAFKSSVPAVQPSSGERLQPIRSRICFRGRVHPRPELQPLPDSRGSLLRTRGEEPRGTPGAGGKHCGFLGWGGMGSIGGEGGCAEVAWNGVLLQESRN